MSELTVTIVGCGVIGYNHARAMVALGGLRIAALVDAIPAAAAKLADYLESELSVPRPPTFETLADAGHADLVVICTPSGLHVSVAEQAISGGSNVVIEKPLDVNLPRARLIAELAHAAEAKGLVVSVISQHRFDPASVVVDQAIRSGAFGRITSAVASVAWWRSQEYYDSGDWRGTWELDGGGAAMNQGVHTIDLLVWFLGTPVRISAETGRLAHDRIDVEDIAVATIRFESGALAVLHATTAAFPQLSVRVQVHGDRGSAILDDDQLAFFHAGGDGSDAGGGNQAADVVAADEVHGAPKADDSFTQAHLRQYRDIVRAIDTHTAPGVRVDDALISLATVESLYVSATLGVPVLFADVLAGRYDETVLVTGGTQ
ncbi:MAG: Gfo/Idh/MocA family oxidoreductase [Pseudolysinimonas sp.]